MEKEELIKKARERLDAMNDSINGCFELLNGIYAERQLVAYLLWLSEGNKEQEQ